eukprot:2349758-Prorocentrum_lima.AAC.1
MTSSLVGSEMCIRDRYMYCAVLELDWGQCHRKRWSTPVKPGRCLLPRPVSYTHLTLPTICSV